MIFFRKAACFLAAGFLVLSCSGKAYESAAQMDDGQAAVSLAERPRAESAGGAGEQGDSLADARTEQKARKLVKQADIRLRVSDLEEAEKPVRDALEKYGGYSAQTVIRESSRHYTLRVPSAFYDEFLSALAAAGKVLYRAETAEDVTLRYYDLEGRLKTKQDLLLTFRAYLGKAKNIEEILSVETRIAELQNEIDWLGSEFKTLADLVDYATIELEIELPAAAGGSWEPTLFERIAEVFLSFGGFLKTALVVVIGVIVYGIPLLALAAFAYWLLLGKLGLLRRLWRIIGKKSTLN
jgi:hypothetical protein